jgi:hypothetical protein
MNDIIIRCPSCKNLVIINKKDINCSIFRHGVLKYNNKQIDPHSSKEKCDKLVKEGKIYGCGKPFKLIKNKNNFYSAIKCDYI